ncbi:MAG: hypothetical protein M3303_00670 [Gemmatimonadota bacterium]|nr:hypothetical protein [Gemmatimonadota bacterium]
MTVFGIVRVLLGGLGALLAFQAIYAVPATLYDGAWGPAISALVGGIFGVWLFRVGLNGTFSGQPREPRATDRDSAV